MKVYRAAYSGFQMVGAMPLCWGYVVYCIGYVAMLLEKALSESK